MIETIDDPPPLEFDCPPLPTMILNSVILLPKKQFTAIKPPADPPNPEILAAWPSSPADPAP